MNPQAPSITGLAAPAAPTATPVAPSGAPTLPALPQGTIAPTLGQTAPSQFNTAGAMNAIANYYQIPRNTALAQAGVEGNKFNATTAYEGQLQEQSEFAKEKLDARAYKIEQTPGGIKILDPVSGQEVDRASYVNRTGSEGFNNMMDALKQSAAPRDKQFVSDYSNFQTYINAAVTAKYDAKGKPINEAANIVDSYENSPGNEAIKGLHAMPNGPQIAAQMFNGEYGDYLGISPTAQAPAHASYTPSLSQKEIDYLLSRTLYSGNPPAGTTGLNFDYLTGGGGGGGVSSLGPPKL